MNKKFLVILADGFEEIEAVTVIDVLRRAGVEVFVAGLIDNKVKGSRQITVLADGLLAQVNSDFDGLVLPGGGQGALRLAESDKVNALIKGMFAKNKIIAAICAAPAIVLSPLGILAGKKATCFPGMEEKFNQDVKFVAKAVVIDGNIITSRAPGTAMEFALAIVEEISGFSMAQKVRQAVLQ
jgi:4-methyl-5(b-hydroxyethyl)-thiazole monophosphate biosynthesis